MEEEVKQETGYKGATIVEQRWFAVIDTDDNSIVHIDGFVEQARDIIKDIILPAEEEEWLKAHPEYKELDVPDEVLEALEKRFIIVSCIVAVALGAYLWRSK